MVQVFQGLGLGSGSRVWVQVLEVALSFRSSVSSFLCVSLQIIKEN